MSPRQIALSIGTPAGLRISLSNALRHDRVSFGAVHVAQWAGDSKTATSAILPATDCVVTFGGSGAAKIAAAEEVFSDPIALPLPTGADLAVSLYSEDFERACRHAHGGGQTTFLL